MKPHRRHAGHTLLELIMATVIVAATLVPALSLFRSSMEVSDEINRRNTMATYCCNKLEEQIAITAASWATGTLSGDFAADGHADIRFTIVKSDDPSDGGITGQLMSITVTTYDDKNQDDALGASERSIIYRTKVAKMATYEDKANN